MVCYTVDGSNIPIEDIDGQSYKWVEVTMKRDLETQLDQILNDDLEDAIVALRLRLFELKNDELRWQLQATSERESDLAGECAELRNKVRSLESRLAEATPPVDVNRAMFDPSTLARVVMSRRVNGFIPAIKMMRDLLPGAGLKECKEWMDRNYPRDDLRGPT